MNDTIRTTKKGRVSSNIACMNKWYDKPIEERRRHAQVMKIYLMSPMIFGNVVTQADRWIKWAHEYGLLPSDIEFDVLITPNQNLFDNVDLVEDAFDWASHCLETRSGNKFSKLFDMMDKVNTCQDLNEAINYAEEFQVFLDIRKGFQSRSSKKHELTVNLALLLAANQIFDHVKQLLHDVNLTQKFEKTCADGEQKIREAKDEGNQMYIQGKYRAAISSYNSGLRLHPYSYLVFGNRAQCYLKTEKLECALLDGRRAAILKPDWHKGQYRYARAYFLLGNLDRAIQVNKAARKASKDGKDLLQQYEKFMQKLRGRERFGDKNKDSGTPAKKAARGSEPDDLPLLVEAGDSDSSGSDADEGDDSDTSMKHCQGMPELASDSPEESGSDVEHERNEMHELKMEVLGKALQNETKRLKEMRKREKQEEEEARRQAEEKRAAAKELKAKIKRQKKEQREKEKGEEADQKKRHLKATVKQGSEALMVKKAFRSAVHYYKEGLAIIAEANFQSFGMEEVDFVLLLYAHGTACLETGIHEELPEAIRQFERIISDHKNVEFPQAYYGLGKVYRKQNRFLEALEPLEQGLKLLKALGNEPCVCKWPGSDLAIDETKPGKLREAIQEVMTVCRNPPKPDAVCRFLECNGKTQIFCGDPDYKGFVRLICHEACRVEFHPVCWKAIKSNDTSGDRDYIDKQCMTPDCHGRITNIQIFDSSGLKTELKSEKLNFKNEPEEKNNKGKEKPSQTTKNTKQEKWKHERDDTKAGPVGEKVAIPAEEKKENARGEAAPGIEAANGELPAHKESQETVQVFEGLPDAIFDPGAVTVLKKGNPGHQQAGLQPKLGGKSKAKKSKKKQQKPTKSLEEFLHGVEVPREPFRPVLDFVDDFGEIPEHSSLQRARARGWPDPPVLGSMFVVPPHLRAEHKAFEESYRSASIGDIPAPFSSDAAPDSARRFVASKMEEILSDYGQLGISDPPIVLALSLLSDEHQRLILEAGGIKPFLSKCEQFVFEGNSILLRRDSPYRDTAAFEKSKLFNPGHFEQKNAAQVRKNPPPGFEVIPDFDDVASAAEDAWFSQVGNFSGTFNLHAEEFIPESQSPRSMAAEACAFGVSETVDSSDKQKNSDSSDRKDPKSYCRVATQLDDVSKEVALEKPRNAIPIKADPPGDTHQSTKEKAGESNADASNGKRGTDKESAAVAAAAAAKRTAENGFAGGNDHSSEDASTSLVAHNQMNGSAANSGVNGCEKNGDSVKGHPEESRAPKVPNAGKASGGGEGSVGLKAKGTQTTPQVKTKGVMTDPQPEQNKVEYAKIVSERDALKAKVKELKDSAKAESQAKERITKKLANAQQEIKELVAKLEEETKAKVEQAEKLQQAEQQSEMRIKVLEKQKQEAADRFESMIANLRKDMSATKGLLQKEREDKAKKEETYKSMSTQGQEQKMRAQDAEVKLLELRRDVGLRFLDRAFQESLLTHTHLVQAMNARIPTLPAAHKLEEMTGKWKTYAAECQQRIHQCRTSFDDQIQQLKSGTPLASLPQLPIAGPPQYPGPPILQPLVPQGQGQQPPHPQPVDNNLVAQPQPPPQAQAQAPAHSAQKLPRVSLAGAPSSGGQAAVGQDAAAAAATTAPTESKSKPSNSFEKIMLRLSTMYPNLTRLELTSFIKQVRQNKHGSLTGLSLEDIVASVSELVQKVKAPPTPSAPVHASPPRPTLGMSSGFGPAPGSVPLRPTVPASVIKPFSTELPNAPQELGKRAPGRVDDDDPCVICHEDMSGCAGGVTRLECSHKYHTECIRKWLLGEQSTCPTCRVHALLPDEFPKLNR